MDEDLKTMVREFRASVSDDLSATHRQMTALSEEVRTRIATSETAILNTIRDMAREIDRRLTRLEQHAQETDARFDGIDTRLDGIDTRLDGIDTRLDGIDTRLDGIDTRLDGIDTRLDGIDTVLREIRALLS